MKKFISLFLIAVFVILTFCSCNNASKATDGYAVESTQYYTTTNAPRYDVNDKSYSTSEDASYSTGEVASSPTEIESVEQKLIRRYNISIETLEYDKIKGEIDALIGTYGGYYSSSTENNNSLYSSSTKRMQTRSGNFTIRIPSKSLDEFVSKLKEKGNVISSVLNTDDITESYYSMQSRLEALILQEERLLAMLEKADDLKYMIQLEDKLASVRAEINEINYNLKYYDKAVDYSFVYLNLFEVVEYQEFEEPTFFSRLGNAISETFVVFGEFLGEILIVLVWVLPFMIFGGIIAIIVIACVRKDKKKRLARKQAENSETTK